MSLFSLTRSVYVCMCILKRETRTNDKYLSLSDRLNKLIVNAYFTLMLALEINDIRQEKEIK